jgi:hypothetical protein
VIAVEADNDGAVILAIPRSSLAFSVAFGLAAAFLQAALVSRFILARTPRGFSSLRNHSAAGLWPRTKLRSCGAGFDPIITGSTGAKLKRSDSTSLEPPWIRDTSSPS